jgi:hypothetical protein
MPARTEFLVLIRHQTVRDLHCASGCQLALKVVGVGGRWRRGKREGRRHGASAAVAGPSTRALPRARQRSSQILQLQHPGVREAEDRGRVPSSPPCRVRSRSGSCGLRRRQGAAATGEAASNRVQLVRAANEKHHGLALIPRPISNPPSPIRPSPLFLGFSGIVRGFELQKFVNL